MSTPERPVLAGPWKLIGPNPDLSRVLPGGEEHRVAFEKGRVLYRWTSDHLQAEPWESTGAIIRADEAAGESVEDWFGQECIQSPYFVHDDEVYCMFYGVSSWQFNRPTPNVAQILPADAATESSLRYYAN